MRGYIVPEFHESLSDIHDHIAANGEKWPVIIDVGNLVKRGFEGSTYAKMADEVTECLRYLPKNSHNSFFKSYFKMMREHKDRIIKTLKKANETEDPAWLPTSNPEVWEEPEPPKDDLSGIRHEISMLKKNGKFTPLQRLIERHFAPK